MLMEIGRPADALELLQVRAAPPSAAATRAASSRSIHAISVSSAPRPAFGPPRDTRRCCASRTMTASSCATCSSVPPCKRTSWSLPPTRCALAA
eukprot:4690434-Prymnesium_polylepis.1